MVLYNGNKRKRNSLRKILVGGLIFVTVIVLILLNVLLLLRFFGREIIGNQIFEKKSKYLMDRENTINTQGFIINTDKFDDQIGNVQKSAKEYYEIRDKYDDSIPECKATYYGLEWLRYMNDSIVEICTPKSSKINTRNYFQGGLKCTLVHDRFPESYCLAENIAVDLKQINNHYQKIKSSNLAPEEQKGKFPEKGTLKLNCDITSPLWKREYFWEGSEKWLFEGLSANQNFQNENECVAWIDHPVYIIGNEIEKHNLFWQLNMAAEAFLSFALYDINLDAQIIIIDQILDEDIKSYFGVGYELLTQMFSPKRPPRTLNSILQETITKYSGNNNNNNQQQQQQLFGTKKSDSVCFRKMMFNTYGFRSFLSKNNRMRTRCRNSASVNGFVDMLTDAMNITTNFLPPSLTSNSPILKIVWVSRHGFSRNIENEKLLIQTLNNTITKMGHKFFSVEMHKMQIIDQMRLVRGTDILVGLHGAGLTHAYVLPQTSALIEMELEGRGEAYRNLGIWRNLFYVKYYHSTLNPDVEVLAGVVQDVIKQVQKRVGIAVPPLYTLSGTEYKKNPCGLFVYEDQRKIYQDDCSDP